MRDFDICESTHNLNTNGVISLEMVQKETNSINEIHLFDHWIELPWTWAVPDFRKSCDSVTLTSLSDQCKPWSPPKLPWAKWKLFCPRYHKLFGNILILYISTMWKKHADAEPHQQIGPQLNRTKGLISGPSEQLPGGLWRVLPRRWTPKYSVRLAPRHQSVSCPFKLHRHPQDLLG